MLGAASSLGDPTRDVKRVVIVDDSQAMRGWLRLVMEQDPRLTVVGEAASAYEARHVIKQVSPDVLTLDIEMPGMNGLDFLERLMRLRPMPVVMITGATRNHSTATIQALSLGAIDYILKPTAANDQAAQLLMSRRVYSAACSTVQPREMAQRQAALTVPVARTDVMPLIMIGASTGGVAALETVLSGLDPSGPPVVIVQHMPGPFLVSFAKQLNRQLDQNVGLVREREVLQPGQIRLAPADGAHTEVLRKGTAWTCRFVPEGQNTLHCPSVDVLFHSATRHASDVIAVMLTGLGHDGAEGMVELRANGASTLGQDEATSVVYGMPRVAYERGGVQKQLPLGRLGNAINGAVAAWYANAEKGRPS